MQAFVLEEIGFRGFPIPVLVAGDRRRVVILLGLAADVDEVNDGARSAQAFAAGIGMGFAILLLRNKFSYAFRCLWCLESLHVPEAQSVIANRILDCQPMSQMW